MGQQEVSMYAEAVRERRQNLLLETPTVFCLSVLASPGLCVVQAFLQAGNNQNYSPLEMTGKEI